MRCVGALTLIRAASAWQPVRRHSTLHARFAPAQCTAERASATRCTPSRHSEHSRIMAATNDPDFDPDGAARVRRRVRRGAGRRRPSDDFDRRRGSRRPSGARRRARAASSPSSRTGICGSPPSTTTIRKRTTRERHGGARRAAQADLVKQLLDALDDLARFAHVDPATVDAATVVQGAEMVEKKLLKALDGAGLEIVDPGQPDVRSRRCTRQSRPSRRSRPRTTTSSRASTRSATCSTASCCVQRASS